MKEIYIKNPDGDLCYDGEETNDPEFDEMLEDWRFEMNTYNYKNIANENKRRLAGDEPRRAR